MACHCQFVNFWSHKHDHKLKDLKKKILLKKFISNSEKELNKLCLKISSSSECEKLKLVNNHECDVLFELNSSPQNKKTAIKGLSRISEKFELQRNGAHSWLIYPLFTHCIHSYRRIEQVYPLPLLP